MIVDSVDVVYMGVVSLFVAQFQFLAIGVLISSTAGREQPRSQ